MSEASFSNDGITWSAWQTYGQILTWSITPGDGEKMVYAHFRDAAGNISEIVSDTIFLDTSVPAEYGFSINNGSLFTNSTSVTLSIGAEIGTQQIMVSNDGDFLARNGNPMFHTRIGRSHLMAIT